LCTTTSGRPIHWRPDASAFACCDGCPPPLTTNNAALTAEGANGRKSYNYRTRSFQNSWTPVFAIPARSAAIQFLGFQTSRLFRIFPFPSPATPQVPLLPNAARRPSSIRNPFSSTVFQPWSKPPTMRGPIPAQIIARPKTQRDLMPAGLPNEAAQKAWVVDASKHCSAVLTIPSGYDPASKKLRGGRSQMSAVPGLRRHFSIVGGSVPTVLFSYHPLPSVFRVEFLRLKRRATNAEPIPGSISFFFRPCQNAPPLRLRRPHQLIPPETGTITFPRARTPAWTRRRKKHQPLRKPKTSRSKQKTAGSVSMNFLRQL